LAALSAESAIRSIAFQKSGYVWRQLLVTTVARDPPICTLIRVDCLVTADAPNGLICIGQQLGALIPGVMARRELP
jgi:hypothetical protein